MRHIVYRAKRVDGVCFWAEGYIVKTPITAEFNDANGSFFDSGKTRYCIVTEFGVAHEIEPETICQFTGLKDKNGNEIYESDLITDKSGRVWEIKWRNAPVGFGLFIVNEKKKKFDGRIGRFTTSMIDYQMTDMEVIGNIYENSELLKAKEGKV